MIYVGVDLRVDPKIYLPHNISKVVIASDSEAISTELKRLLRAFCPRNDGIEGRVKPCPYKFVY